MLQHTHPICASGVCHLHARTRPGMQRVLLHDAALHRTVPLLSSTGMCLYLQHLADKAARRLTRVHETLIDASGMRQRGVWRSTRVPQHCSMCMGMWPVTG
jgi:hypothetical protein